MHTAYHCISVYNIQGHPCGCSGERRGCLAYLQSHTVSLPFCRKAKDKGVSLFNIINLYIYIFFQVAKTSAATHFCSGLDRLQGA